MSQLCHIYQRIFIHQFNDFYKYEIGIYSATRTENVVQIWSFFREMKDNRSGWNILYNTTASQCTWLTVCVGEWNKLHGPSYIFNHRRQVATSLVIRQRRSRVGRWPPQSSYSTAEQSTTTTTRPRRHRVSGCPVAAIPSLLQRTHITTLCSTRQQRYLVAV